MFSEACDGVTWDEITPDVWYCSLASLMASSGICVFYLLVPRLRRAPGWLIMRAFCFDALTSAAYFGLCELKEFRNTMVGAVAFSDICAFAWRLLMYVHLVLIYRNPFSPNRYRVTYQFIPIMIASMVTLILCGVETKESIVKVIDFLLFTVVVLPGVFVIGGLILHAAIWSVVRGDMHSERPASISFLARERVMRHSASYLALHSVQLLLGVLAIVLLVGTDCKWIWHCVAFISCGRPILSLLGWLCINGIPGKAARHVATLRCCSGLFKGASAPADTRTVCVSLAELQTARAPEALAATANSRREVGSPMRESSTFPTPRVGGHEFMKELRFEVLYDVAYSIGDQAQRDLQSRPAYVLQSRAADFEVGRRVSQSLCGGLGALPSFKPSATGDEPVLSSAGLLQRFFTSNELDRQQVYMPTIQKTKTTGGSSTSARIGPPAATHYCVDLFGLIRSAFGVSQERYARDFPNDLSQLSSRWRQKLKESVSEGASGSFFYRVINQREGEGVNSHFIVKQITAAEKDTLLEILPAYKKYVVEREGRSFIQYFGCHSIPLRWKYASRVFFVVMRNFLPVHMWLAFDLKGATANRRALAAESLLQRQDGRVPRESGNEGYGTLRDWEWMDIAMTVDVDPEDKVELAEILASDAAFLSSQGLLDYSLLVGIHRLSPDLDPAARESRLEELCKAGGYSSLDRQKVYFFGVIDVLERYSLRWRVQRLVLRTAYHLALLGKEADGISAMPPAEYADRFRAFVNSELLRLPRWVGDGANLQAEDSEDEISDEEEQQMSPARSQSLAVRRFSSRAWRPSRSQQQALCGLRRWAPLWRTRRRGLMQERMEAERTDFIRRIRDLEAELEDARLPAPRISGSACFT